MEGKKENPGLGGNGAQVSNNGDQTVTAIIPLPTSESIKPLRFVRGCAV